MDLTSMPDDEAATYYAAHAPPGAPPWDPSLRRYLPDLSSGRAWDDIVRQRAIGEEIAARVNDIAQPIYGPGLIELPEAARGEFDRACAVAASQSKCPADLPVALAFCNLLPALNLAPLSHDEQGADYAWRVVRMATWEFEQTAIAAAVGALYPSCPFVAEPSMDDAREAHRTTGLPSELARMPWKLVCESAAHSDNPYAPWIVIAVAFHILRHTRFDPAKNTVVVLYQHQARSIPLPSSHLDSAMKAVCGALGIKLKSDNPAHVVAGWLLSRIAAASLVQLKPLGLLPPNVLAGSWSTLVPHPSSDGMLDFGLALAGVRVAREGRIIDPRDDTSLVSEYAWNITGAAALREDQERFERTCPRAYEATFPSNIICEAFPNLVATPQTQAESDALDAWLDAPIVASLIRPQVPQLAVEFPFVCFFPEIPTLSDSTDQGKTLAAKVYGWTLAPGARVERLKDGDSAPDSRAAQHGLMLHGTLVLDEFFPPNSKAHMLSRDNIQTLCTGGSIAAGLVMSNDPPPVKLRHSLVASSKALPLPPDLVNRLLPWYLRKLTSEEMARPGVADDMEQGITSIRIRVAAWGLVEKLDLITRLRAAPIVRSQTCRFAAHRMIALWLWRVRQGRKDGGEAEIDAALASMRARHEEHVREASVNGVLSALEEGRTFILSLGSIFDDGVSVADIQYIAENQERHKYPGETEAWCSAAKFLKWYAEARGWQTGSLRCIVENCAGKGMHMTDGTIARAFLDEVRRTIQEGQLWPLPGHLGVAGWMIHRGKDRNGTPKFRLVKRGPEGQAPSTDET